MHSSVITKAGRFALSAQKNLVSAAATYATDAKVPSFETLAVTVPKPFVYHVELNRPAKVNTFNRTLWRELENCFGTLGDDPDCRAIVLSGAGRLFSGGNDLNDFAQMASVLAEYDDVARRCKVIYNILKSYQDSLSSLEKCPKPVISAVHNGCIGAGFNMIAGADIRYCTSDAWFQLKEVPIGLAADVGGLQRLPKIVGNDSLIRELAFTGRKLDAKEAKECGMVSRVFDTKENMINGAIELAAEIASKSPVAVQLTKRSLVYSRDHTVQDGLDHVRHWNMTMLQSEDLMKAVMAAMTKGSLPEFSKL